MRRFLRSLRSLLSGSDVEPVPSVVDDARSAEGGGGGFGDEGTGGEGTGGEGTGGEGTGGEAASVVDTWLVFERVCSRVADQMADTGFRFVKADPSLYRKKDDFRFDIEFLALSAQDLEDEGAPRPDVGGLEEGLPVTMRVAAHVRSPRLRKWRKQQEHALDVDDWIGGALLGRLVEPHSSVEWRLDDPCGAEAIAIEVVAAIRSWAIPYFTGFLKTSWLLGLIKGGGYHFLQPAVALEYAICFGNRMAAIDLKEHLLEHHEEHAERYSMALEHYRSFGIDSAPPTGDAEQLAWIVVAHDLELPPQNDGSVKADGVGEESERHDGES